MDINDLDLSVRAFNALQTAGIKSVEDLIRFDWNAFAEQKAVGVKTIGHLAAAMVELHSGDLLRRAKEYDETCCSARRVERLKARLVRIGKLCDLSSI